MAASSKRRKKRGNGFVLRGFVATGEMVARNPAIAGGGMAFLVALSFVSANALWYQPHFYDRAFFATRGEVRDSPPVTVGREEEPRIIQPTARPVPPPDVTETTGAVQPASGSALAGETDVSRVQSALAALGLYKGEVDGLSGPRTKDAIAGYQRIVGVEETGRIDAALLQHLGLMSAPPAVDTPAPSPRPQTNAATVIADARQGSAAGGDTGAPAAQTRKIQAGLKAFGNDGIEIDGVAGADTQAALREFQSLFGLQVTGEPSPEVLAKMKAIGLVN